MAGTKDKYGIPAGGNNGPYAPHKWQGLSWQLTWEELIASVALGGWPRNAWGTAAAVAAAESSRNPFIYNTYKMGHFGIFQISRSAWPGFFSPNGEGMLWVDPVANAKQAYAIYKQQGFKAWSAYSSGAYLANYPAAMTASANVLDKLKVHGGDENGFLHSLIRQSTQQRVIEAALAGADPSKIRPVAGEAVAGAIDAAAGAAAQGTVDSGAAAASAINSSFGWLPDLYTSLTTPAVWMRFAYGLTGIALVAGGLFLIVRSRPAVQKTAKAVTGAVTNVVPAGRAAKVATAAKGASA